jgi:3-methyladenine DNA glycosylase AlkD
MMAQLQSLGSEKMREINARNGVDENQFGVKMGDVRAIAKQIKTDPNLADELWQTGNFEARLLATLIMKPKQLSTDEVDAMVRSIKPSRPTDESDATIRSTAFSQVADYLMTNVVKQHPQKEDLRRKWMASDDVLAARAGWSLTAERVAKSPDGLDLNALLDRIEAQMGDAPPLVQWTMNFTLAEIGINHPEHRQRALAIGEKLGIFRDYPVSKGCTSPFAPIWINEMVSRQAA